MNPRILIGVAPGLMDAAICAVSTDAHLVGNPTKFWNGLHFEFSQDTVDEFQCIEALRLDTADVPAKLRKMVLAAKKQSIPVRVVVDRSAVSDPILWDVWRAVADARPKGKRGVDTGDASCIVLDIDTDARAPVHQGVRILSLKGHDGGGPERVHGRDIAGAVAWLQGRKRVKLSPSAAQASALADELNGFNGQPERRLARALALALYVGYASPTGAVPCGLPEMVGEEKRMLDNAQRDWNEDDDDDRDDDDDG